MYSLSVENESGERLDLTGNPAYDIIDVSGTNPPPANINTAGVSGLDGTRFNSATVGQRNIVITMNIKDPIEQNRIALYKFFRVKHKIRVFYKNNLRDVYIDGYVETFENNPWTKLQQPQISIICPQPFWLSAEETSVDFADSQSLFEFPFSISSAGIPFSQQLQLAQTIINSGEIETGGIITIKALSDGVDTPVFYNDSTGQYIGIDMVMQQDDTIIIDTITGEKSVKLKRGTSITNIMNQRIFGSSWVQFRSGENVIRFTADENEEYLFVNVSLVQKFEGV